MEKQVAAYSQRLEVNGIPLLYARSDISWHGWPAANLMAKYVEGAKKGLPTLEAIQIIRLVQLRGCPLKGTEAEAALEHYLPNAPDGSLERQAARDTLHEISANIIVGDNLDHRKGGPCRDGQKPPNP